MRIILLLIILAAATAAKAQTVLPGSFMDYRYEGLLTRPVPLQGNDPKKKWTFSRYTALSAGYSFFKGGSASVVAAPMGLQVARRLTGTLYAFAGVSVAPAYIRFNGAMLPADLAKTATGNSFLRSNSFGMYSRAELGLMYVSPDKTFSISGSIGVERSSAPAFYYPANTVRPNTAVSPNR